MEGTAAEAAWEVAAETVVPAAATGAYAVVGALALTGAHAAFVAGSLLGAAARRLCAGDAAPATAVEARPALVTPQAAAPAAGAAQGAPMEAPDTPPASPLHKAVRNVQTARREDERLARQEEAARRRASQEEEKRKRIMAALRREEDTRRRAAEAMAMVQAEKERQLAEAAKRKLQFSKRTGGGFVVNFKPEPKEEEEAVQKGSDTVRDAWAERRAGAAGSRRRPDLTEALDDA